MELANHDIHFVLALDFITELLTGHAVGGFWTEGDP